MNGIIGLIQNENMKIYRRIRTWIFYILILAAVVISGYVIANNTGLFDRQENWKQQLQQQTADMERQLQEADFPKSLEESLKNDIKLNEYALKNNINPYKENAWTFVKGSVALVTLVTLFVVIIASDMIAGENAWGTIKMLLIRPHSRWKILLSKFLATILFAIVIMIFLLLVSWIVGNIIYGFGGLSDKYLTLNGLGEVDERLVFFDTLKIYGLEMVRLVIIVTLAFMISTIFNSSTFAVGVSIVVLLAGSGIVMALSHYEWVKYTLFANLDVGRYVDQTYNTMFKGMTLSFSITVLLIHFIVMIAITWGIFIKRDVKA
jgi:ABC-2 type transport system permease protein